MPSRVATRPIGERRFRTLAAALLAPASLVVLDLLSNAMGSFHVEGHIQKYFDGLFTFTVVTSYLGSAIVGGVAFAFRRVLRLPLLAGWVVAMFVLSGVVIGILLGSLFGATWPERGLAALLLAIRSLPVSLSYCLVAGVRWRRG